VSVAWPSLALGVATLVLAVLAYRSGFSAAVVLPLAGSALGLAGMAVARIRRR
jgi:VIT1/CCC1 family predicted Fe2+/Mn2+ transporter